MPLALSATVNQSIQTAVPPPLPAPLINTMQNGNERIVNQNGATNGNLSDSSRSNGVNNGEKIVNGQKPIRKPPSKPRVWPTDSDLKNGMKNGGEVNGNSHKEMNGKPPVRPPIRPTKMNAPLATNGVTAKLIMRSSSARSLDSNTRLNKSSPKPITNGYRPISASLRLPISRGSTPDSSLKSYSRESSIISRSPSPCLSSTLNSISSISSRGSYTDRLNEFRRSLTPRRVFPQHYFNENPMDINEMHHLEQSSVIFDANLQFVLGCEKQRVHQAFRASPAHSEKETASNYLSDKINDFLQRTDHINEEWKLLGKRTIDDDTVSMIERQRKEDRKYNIVTKSKSAANIMIKGFQLISKQPRTPISRSNSIARDDIDDDQCTIVDASEVCLVFDLYGSTEYVLFNLLSIIM